MPTAQQWNTGTISHYKMLPNHARGSEIKEHGNSNFENDQDRKLEALFPSQSTNHLHLSIPLQFA